MRVEEQKGYPGYRCSWCTLMRCHGVGEICWECQANYVASIKARKEKPKHGFCLWTGPGVVEIYDARRDVWVKMEE